MTDAEAIELIRAFEFRRQNAAAEFVRGRWVNREEEYFAKNGTNLACTCLLWCEGDYVAAYEYAKDR